MPALPERAWELELMDREAMERGVVSSKQTRHVSYGESSGRKGKGKQTLGTNASDGNDEHGDIQDQGPPLPDRANTELLLVNQNVEGLSYFEIR